MTAPVEPKAELGGRLQRPGSATSTMVTSFQQVLGRHGLTMVTALVFALMAVQFGLDRPVALPAIRLPASLYLGAGALMLLFAAAFWRVRGLRTDAQQWKWLAYLLAISAIEEMAFRVFFPMFLSHVVEPKISVLVSNALFAGLHYVTLRWRLSNCVWVFFGGLGLARLFHESGDLALIIGVHWFATFLNTPTPPGSRRAIAGAHLVESEK